MNDRLTFLHWSIHVLRRAAVLGLVLAVQKVREAASRIQCANNLKQLGLAMHAYHDARGYLPPGITTWMNSEDAAHTGFTYMLPYLEQENVYRQFRLKQQWYKRRNYAPWRWKSRCCTARATARAARWT
jgi:hypothetical protein